MDTNPFSTVHALPDHGSKPPYSRILLYIQSSEHNNAISGIKEEILHPLRPSFAQNTKTTINKTQEKEINQSCHFSLMSSSIWRLSRGRIQQPTAGLTH